MAKFVCYDSQHNKMVFTLANADVQMFKTAYEHAGELWDKGYGYKQGTNTYWWRCGTPFVDALTGWNAIMYQYAPYPQAKPGSSLLGGFTVAELVSRGYYTAGTTKYFYLDNNLSGYIKITSTGTHLDDFGHTIYDSYSCDLKLSTMATEVNLGNAGNTYNFGLVYGTFDGGTGYYFIEQSSDNAGNHEIVDIRIKADKVIAADLKTIAGQPPTPPSVSPSNDPLGLWGGDGVGTGDDITMPGAPDETISGALAHGFLNIYAPTDAQLRAFGGLLWTNAFNVKWYDLDSVSNLILNAVSDPIDYIVGLFMIPVKPTTGSSSGIYLGGINANTVTAPRVTQQFATVDFGTIEIPELYGNYLDYSNSRLSIYLPYIGTADLDVQEVNGGEVSLKYTVDCFTGACVANVRCKKTIETPWGEIFSNKTVHSYSGNMAIQLPISAASFDTMMNGLVNIGLGLGTNSPAMVMQGATNAVQGFAGDVTTRGSLSSNTGKLCYQKPYLMFTRPIESLPAKVGKLHGYGAGSGGKLGSFAGYVVCSDVKLDGVTATDNELNEIESLLKTGVYV